MGPAPVPSTPRSRRELLDALQAANPRFNELWQEHAVRRFEASRKLFQHPSAWRLDLDYIKLATADSGQQHLVVYPPTDAASAAKLPDLHCTSKA